MLDWEIEYNRAFDDLKNREASHNKTKAELIEYMAKQLIIGGYEWEKISSKLRQDLEGIVSADYVSKICAKLGCTDPRFTNTVYVDNGDGTQSEMEQEGGDKDPKEKMTPEQKRIYNFVNMKITEGDVQKVVPSPNGQENLAYAQHIWKVQDFLQNMLDNLKNKAFLSEIIKDPQAKSDLEEWMTVTEGAIDLAIQEWDDRNLVSVQTHYKLAELVSASTIKFGAKQYLGWVKEQAKISSKQVTKILYGRTKKVDQMYEPISLQDAKDSGFSGVQCPNTQAGKQHNQSCGSYRVRLEHGWAHCFACDHDFDVKSLPLGQFKEESGEDQE